jgi:putative membrane protein
MPVEESDETSETSIDAWRKLMLFHNRERTRLTNERNFLAWVRTSLALITLGFVVQRFDLILEQANPAVATQVSPALLTWVPLIFFLLGGVIVALGTLEFLRVRKEIAQEVRTSQTWIRDSLIVTLLIFILVVTLIFLISKP